LWRGGEELACSLTQGRAFFKGTDAIAARGASSQATSSFGIDDLFVYCFYAIEYCEACYSIRLEGRFYSSELV
jgi:hypothetical protein